MHAGKIQLKHSGGYRQKHCHNLASAVFDKVSSVLFQFVIALKRVVLETALSERLQHHVTVYDLAHDVEQRLKTCR